MFRSYDHHLGDSQILAKITFIYNTLYVPIFLGLMKDSQTKNVLQ